jgi:protein-disulfide isomerase
MISNSDRRTTVHVVESDHVWGPPTAPVTLLEYGDYECPYCGQAHFVVKELLRHLGRTLRFVYRHFPLTMIHPHAQRAAEAAEAAGAQGKFWDMHDMLFENQQALDDHNLVLYATALDLDVSRFTDDLATHAHLDRIGEDFRRGARNGVNGTPTFMINGVRHDGPFDLISLMDSVGAAMQPTAYKFRQDRPRA